MIDSEMYANTFVDLVGIFVVVVFICVCTFYGIRIDSAPSSVLFMRNVLLLVYLDGFIVLPECTIQATSVSKSNNLHLNRKQMFRFSIRNKMIAHRNSILLRDFKYFIDLPGSNQRQQQHQPKSLSWNPKL